MQSDNAPKEPSTTMLYVSNLPFSFEDADLKAVFNGFDVTSAYVAARRNGRSKGFGFVTFSTPDQQKKALAAVDGKELDGRTLTVKVAHKDERRDVRGELKEEFKTETREPRRRRPANERAEGGNNSGNAAGNSGGNRGGGRRNAPANHDNQDDSRGSGEKEPSPTVLYVSNLPFEFEDADLFKVFAAHHPVSARIARRRNDRSKGFGFVEFSSNKDQAAALALNGHRIEDREIAVKVSMVPKAGSAPAKSNDPSDTTLYVSNLPFDLTDEQLGELFSTKGQKPTSARIARRRDERSKGFGFVEFATKAAQTAGLQAVDGTSIGDRVVSVKVALKDSETRNNAGGAESGDRQPSGGNRRGGRNQGAAAASSTGGANNNNNAPKQDGDKPKRRRKPRGPKPEGGSSPAPRAEQPPREKKPSDTLVYVSNLAFEVTDQALAQVFEGLGVKSAHVAVRRNGRSKGFGFVEFNSHADQQKALSKTGTQLGGRELTVEVAKEAVAPSN